MRIEAMPLQPDLFVERGFQLLAVFLKPLRDIQTGVRFQMKLVSGRVKRETGGDAQLSALIIQ